jgi:hypothetical protein
MANYLASEDDPVNYLPARVNPNLAAQRRRYNLAERQQTSPLMQAGNVQFAKELSSMGNRGAVTDLINRGLIANTAGLPVDMLNTVLQTLGLGSEQPLGGSDSIRRALEYYGLSSETQRPMLETLTSLTPPRAVMGAARVAGQGAEAVGRAAAPVAGQALENYMGRTGMRLSAVPELSTMRLFHRSPQENLVEVDKSGRFGGIFAGSDPESAIGLSPRKTFLHYADVPENSIADSSALINASENKINVANNAIKNSINPKYHQQENIDAIKDVALNDRNIFKMIDPNTNKPTEELQSIFKALGTDDLGEVSWELQKIRGSIAKELGFKAVTMSDEQGLSYFLTPGIKLKAGKGE